MKRDFYEVLGLSKGADEKTIKKSYHKLAKKYHPDTNQGDSNAEQKFKEVSEAYEVLSDPEKKKLYDTYGMAAFDESSGNFYKNQNGGASDFNGWHKYSSGDGFGGSYSYSSSSSENMDDILKNIFGGNFNGNFGGFSGNTGSFKSRRGGFSADDFMDQSPADSHAELTVSLYDAAFGADKRIRLDGHSSDLQVHIPAGINDGQTLRLKGKGTGGKSDLLLKIKLAPDATYERKGQDIYTTTQIPFTTAVLGGNVKMHTLYGNVECSIPAGTQSGSKIRLKNKGIVSMKNKDKYGDEYVTIQIQVPRSVSPEEKQLIQQLADIDAQRRREAYSA